MRPRVLSWLLLAALLPSTLAPGCSITDVERGGALPDDAWLEVGVTTKATALARLGAPRSVRRQADGDLLIWRRDALHSERLLLVPLVPLYEDVEGRSGSDLLVLLFDAAGVLRGVGRQQELPLGE